MKKESGQAYYEDARAVENPISSIFDLSEDVAKQAPVIRSLVRYASAFIAIWLFVNLILMLALLGQGQLFLFLIMVGLFIIGLVSIVLLRRMSRFFRYYEARHRSIKAIREMDPMVYAPKGNTATERFLAYMRGHNKALFGKEVVVAMPGIVQGQHGTGYSFDTYVKEEPGFLWNLFSLGKHGFAIYVKHFDHSPQVAEIKAFKDAVQDVTARTNIPPSRVVALWERKEDEILRDDVYHFIMSQPIKGKHIIRKYTCSMEVVSETDGSYDFIPHISNIMQVGFR